MKTESHWSSQSPGDTTVTETHTYYMLIGYTGSYQLCPKHKSCIITS